MGQIAKTVYRRDVFDSILAEVLATLKAPQIYRTLKWTLTT